MEDLFDTYKWDNDTKYVYHYTSWATARDFILGGKEELRFGNTTRMNDPFEFSALCLSMSHSNEFNLEADKPKLMQDNLVAVRQECKLFCTTMDSPYKETNNQILIDDGLRGFAHPSMWNHYGDGHKGVCLILDKEKLIETTSKHFTNGETILFDQILYSQPSDPLLGRESNLKLTKEIIETDDNTKIYEWAKSQVLDQLRVSYLFSKHYDWNQENEFRCVIHEKENEFLYLPIKNTGLVAGIVVGCDFDISENNKVLEICKGRNIEARRIFWANSTPNAWLLKSFEIGGLIHSWELESKQRRDRQKSRESFWGKIRRFFIN